MHAQPQLLVGALIDMHLDPLGISSQPAIPLLGSDTILITPFTLLAQAEPDQISFLMVQNFGLKLTPIHRLAENRDIYIAYIIERMKEIVGIEDTTWNAAVLLSAQNEKMVFILPPVATCIHNLNSECRPTQAQTCPTITDDQLYCNEQGNNIPEIPRKRTHTPAAPPTYDEDGTRIRRTYKRKSANPHQAEGITSLPSSSNILNFPLEKDSTVSAWSPPEDPAVSQVSSYVHNSQFFYFTATINNIHM